MSFSQLFRFALGGILSNRLRSVLTMIGVAIGVSSVIVLTAVGSGSAKSVNESIEKLGTNSLTVIKAGFGPFSSSNLTTVRDLTVDDVKALMNSEKAPHIKSAAPVVSSNVTCTKDNKSSSPSITGTWAGYFESSNSPITKGHYWTNEDVVNAKAVGVIGTTTAKELFGTDNPVGQKILCKGQDIEVVGVLKTKGSSGFQDSDSQIISPLSFVQRNISGYGSLSNIQIQAKDSSSTSQATDEATQILRSEHRIGIGANSDFTILNQASLLQSSSSSSKTLTYLLAIVAAISLLVGGIGITNIMLVSVTERTREIGIRKAIGAPSSTITIQFLFEATLLSGIGGVIGVALGLGISQFRILGIVPVTSASSTALAFFVSLTTGLIFGGWPAKRASQLKPIEALRYQ
jgi:putative ABC transport system permease protein